jgi:hypothetical protein
MRNIRMEPKCSHVGKFYIVYLSYGYAQLLCALDNRYPPRSFEMMHHQPQNILRDATFL